MTELHKSVPDPIFKGEMCIRCQTKWPCEVAALREANATLKRERFELIHANNEMARATDLLRERNEVLRQRLLEAEFKRVEVAR